MTANLYLMQGKSVIKASIKGEIDGLSKHTIRLVCRKENRQEVELYQDMEILVGEENAYAKIMKIEDCMLQLRFTFLSEHFLEVCGYRERRETL